MMKRYAVALCLVLLYACKNNENKAAGTYTPGLGEFMVSIQLHHAKLWFAGENANWPLADFEMHEIMEVMEDIRKFNTDRPEIKSLPMINAPLDSLDNAIQKKDSAAFKSAFTLLTNTCNTCHQATPHGFNVIKIPDFPPVSNQEFKVQ
jgi:uncharacterized membrane protein YfbV (UPF0208 family)